MDGIRYEFVPRFSLPILSNSKFQSIEIFDFLLSVVLAFESFNDGNSRKEFKSIQYDSNRFWTIFISEYLVSLNQRTKWSKEQCNLEVGDLDLISQNSVPLLSSITKIFPSKDSIIRSAEVKLPNTIVKRPAATLCYLEKDKLYKKRGSVMESTWVLINLIFVLRFIFFNLFQHFYHDFWCCFLAEVLLVSKELFFLWRHLYLTVSSQPWNLPSIAIIW